MCTGKGSKENSASQRRQKDITEAHSQIDSGPLKQNDTQNIHILHA